MTLRWRVLCVESGHEARVESILNDDLGFAAFCPKVATRVATRVAVFLRTPAMYGRHLFVELADGDHEGWHRVMGASAAVQRFIGDQVREHGRVVGYRDPMPVERAQVLALRERADEGGVIQERDLTELVAKMRRGFGPGDRLRVVGGPFDGREGTCRWVDDRGVNLSGFELFGKELDRFYVPLAQVLKVEVDGVASASIKRRERRRRALVSGATA